MRALSRGFALIELAAACAAVAILAAVVYPSYRAHVRKAARDAAKAQMMDIAGREYQFLLAHRSFVDATQLQASGYVLPDEVGAKYTYSIAVGSAPPTYTITFTPIGGQTSDGPLSLTNDGTRSPIEKW
jgi:type IV pilus assembly protein PilE